MALQKQPISINFSQGLDLKTDPNQVPVGKFLGLNNMVYNTLGRLTKRNGYPKLTTLPNTSETTLTTLNNNLIATGSNLYSYNQSTDQWLNKGVVQPIQLTTTPIVRTSNSQTSVDMALHSAGLACVVYLDGTTPCYQIIDSATSEQIVSRTLLPATATNARAFVLGRNFIITFIATVSGNPHLQYIAIPVSQPTLPGSPTDFGTTVNTLNAGYDGYVTTNGLYLSWAATGSSVSVSYLTPSLIQSAVAAVSSSHTATLLSITADAIGSFIWITFWDSGTNNGFTTAFTASTLIPQTSFSSPVASLTSLILDEITSIVDPVTNNLVLFFERLNYYDSAPGYPVPMVQTDNIGKVTISTAAVLSSRTTILRSVGLASKPFINNNTVYVIVAYGETNQPTYFLINASGDIYMRLAYSNGGGYETSQVLPAVSSINNQYYAPYLIKDFLATVNKGTNNASGIPVNAIYTQTGINLLKFSINTVGQYSSEIASALHLTGGQLWEYDAVKPVEHSFHVWPENVQSTTATGAGGITAGTYYYQFTYEWTDGQGLLHRSAPSIPIKQVTTTASSTNTLYVPTLRLTYKTAPNPVRIVGYRWSVAQQVYYQFTSLTSPTLNDTTVDYVTITDTSADSDILGQTILYTTGGVIENIAAPASIASALFNNRLWLIDAEDQNLLWYSKQVIEGVPVEMSDLLTFYVAPTSGAQGSTGPITALSAMDDKLIIFKKDAIYYVTGNGPDNTGSNSGYSDAIFVTSSVGCSNPSSIVLMPLGLMFQSDKGIWLLGRDLNTKYIGDAVEAYNSQPILSAQSIPATNQVRFVLGNNVTLMYDYYVSQWGIHSNRQAISSTLYNGMHTYLTQQGTVLRETPNTYIDDATPVLLSFTTSWINVAGLQGYERFYFLYLLGTYYTPYKLNVQIAYDYSPNPTQSIIVMPDNYASLWGNEAQWGSGGPWGGPGNIFQARIFPQVQKCESFQLTITEIYDSSFGVAAGQGLSLSGLNMVIGVKKPYRTQKAGRSFG